MSLVSSNAGLKNPLYEVGINYPVNQRNKHPITNINLPIPKNIIFFREFKAGETLPVYFKASGNLVTLESEPQLLTFVQDIFVRATKEQITFSLDQRNWLPFNQIFTGNIEAKVSQSEENNSPRALIELFANSIGTK